MPITKPELSIRLLGNVSLELDGRPFVMATPRRTLPVLAYLLLNRGASVSREFLAYFMWPDDPEETARTKLRATLFDLARVLPQAPGEKWIVADGDNVGWNPETRLRLDVEEFETLCADPERREAGIELYRGELLAALYDEWIFPPRERYRNLYLATLTDLISEARSDRRFPRAVALAQQLLAVDPWREDVVRRLIAIRYESGDRSGALVEYQRFAERLRAELEIDPMPETEALRDAIERSAPIDPEPAPRRPATPIAPASPSLPFVGRERELDFLDEAWTRAARGNGTAVFVGGESGIGKTRLALEFAHSVEERGGRIMAGATGTPEALPYQSVVEALRSALPLVASLRIRDVWLAGVAALVPELRGYLPSLPDLPRIGGDGERPRLFEALLRTLAELAKPRPLLLILDDVQWAEEATSAAIEFLLQRIATLPILLVMTYRDDEMPRLHPLQRLRRDSVIAGTARSISLRPLSRGDVENLVRALPGSFDTSSDDLFAASEGSPIFLSQFVDGGGSRSAASAANIRTLVGQRIERLSPEARTMAEIAALAGNRFSREVVRQVSGWDGSAADNALDELLDRRFIREASGRGFFDYTFAHHVVAETVAASAQPERAAMRHRRLARALDELYPERAAELAAAIARHYDLAGDEGAASIHYLAAARQALSVGALDEAAAHVRRGLELEPGPATRVDLLLVGEALASRRDTTERREAVLEELDELTRGDAGGERRLEVLLRRIDFADEREDREAEETALEELRLRVEHADGRWSGKLRLAEAQHAIAAGNLAAAEEAAARAIDDFLRCGDRGGEAEARYRLAGVATHRGQMTRAEALLDEARAAGERANDAPLSLRALVGAYQLAFSRRDMPRCLEIGQATLEAGLATGDRRSEAEGHRQIAVALIGLCTRWAEARAHVEAAIAIFREAKDDLGVAQTLLHGSGLKIALGDMHGARADCSRALEILAANGPPTRRTITCLMTLSSAETYAGDPTAAKAHATEALELSRRMGFGVLEASALEDVAYCLASAGDYREAIASMERSLTLRDATESLAWTSVSHAHLGLWHAALGNLDAARRHAVASLEFEDGFARSSPWPQSCHWAVAQVHRLCGDRAAAQRELERAYALLQTMLAGLEEADRVKLMAMRWHADLVAAAQRGVWPDPPR